MLPWLPIALCCLCAGSSIAQGATTTERSPAGPQRGIERTFRGSCSEATSRDLFTACDADGDDRLDVFEASDALETVRDPRDTDGFARLDKNRDGYVTWTEFHGALRTTLQRGDIFRVRTVRPFVPPSPEARPATPLQKFLQLQDTNQNGGLDPAEIDRYLRERELPGLGSLLRSLDKDRSGRLEEAELATWFDKLPGQAEGADAQPASSRLLAPWLAADQNQSGTIDAAELAAVLRHLDPALAHWAAELLRALDRTRDGELQPEELPSGKPGDQPAAIGAGSTSPGNGPSR